MMTWKKETLQQRFSFSFSKEIMILLVDMVIQISKPCYDDDDDDHDEDHDDDHDELMIMMIMMMKMV